MTEPDIGRRALGEGTALFELGRTDEAIAKLSTAVAHDPEDAEAHCRLALALIDAGRGREGLASAEAAAALEPSWEWPQRVRAIALIDVGRTEEALAAAREAVRLEPELSASHEVHADALTADGRHEAAIEAAQRAASLDPEDPGPWTTLGTARAAKKQWFLAVDAYAEALKRDPDDAMAHNNLGYAYLGNDERDLAHECFERAVKIDPSNQLYRDNLALTARAHVNGGWLLLVLGVTVWLGGRGLVRESGDGVAIGAIALAVVVALILAVWALDSRRRLRTASPGVQDLLGRQPFFERFDFHAWTPWPFLIPSPVWFLGSAGALLAIAVSAIAGGSWTIETTAWVSVLTLAAAFSGGRAQLYLKRKGRWPSRRAAGAR